jgi:hypothetical protein
MRVSLTAPTTVFLVALGAGERHADAGQVTVTIDPGPAAGYAQQAGVSLDEIQSLLATELENLYRASGARQYVQGFGDAQAFANKGMGADYASNPQALVVGFAANVAANTDEQLVRAGKSKNPPIEGLGTAFSFLLGANLGALGVEPLTVYTNFFRGGAGVKDFSGTWTSFGVHAQLKFFGSRGVGAVRSRSRPGGVRKGPNPFFNWGGVDLTTGVEYGRLTLDLAQGLQSEIPVTDDASGPRILVDSRGIFDLDMKVWSVPIEVTTNLQVLYFATLYGGVGFDWQAGSNRARMDLDARLLGVIPGDSQRPELGTAKITASEDVGPTPGKARIMLGLQANLWVLRLGTHVNVMPGRGLVGVVLSARLAW